MPGASRVGIDSAGGPIIGPGAVTVLVNGAPFVQAGNSVSPHFPPVPPHFPAPPKMVGCSTTVFAGGLPVCRAGDSASCGHTATGSSDVIAG